MAINLAEKYQAALLRKFTQDSILVGKTANKYDFAGVRSITIYGIVTQPLNDYNRTATANRFGVISELQDTVQELYLTQDKSFSISIDRANKEDTMNNKVAGEVLQAQLDEQSIPFIDKYAFKRYFTKAGRSVAIAEPAVGTIVGLIADGLTQMDNDLVPDNDRFIYIGATLYNKLRLSTEVLAIEPLAAKAIGTGVVATFMGIPVVKVPDSYFPASTFYFLIIRKQSIELPIKFRTLRILTDDKDVDGAIIQGRHYFDAFVLGEHANALYAGINTSVKTGVCTITPTGASHAITCAGSTGILYTIDGSDPRYSKTAIVYASAVTLASGTTIKAAGYTTDKCDGNVASATYTA